ncbi:MAG: DUF1512 domain-containing protein [Thermoprotei archaeon]|nr:MAG: DUF1512 domain-containing protein [Thermoprotei archaeon]
MVSSPDSLWYMLSTILFILFILFNQRIQVFLWLQEINQVLRRLENMVKKSKEILISQLSSFGSSVHEISRRIDEILEFFVIPPVERDPFGVLRRLEHILDTERERFHQIIRTLAPKVNGIKMRNLENMLEAAIALNSLYRLTRHYALLGRRTKSVFMIMQLEMMLPQITRFAEAYYNAVVSFKDGVPIGDGIGALVVSKLIRRTNAVIKAIKNNTIIAETKIMNRKVLLIKALGPGGEIGKPGTIVEELLSTYKNPRISRIIMIDAAQKLEGEKSGEIVEGVGAAIGDPGPEKMKIEEAATRYGVPIDAIIVKESFEEAISPMTREIAEAADKVIERIYDIISSRTKEGDAVIIAGIGNSIGIAQ